MCYIRQASTYGAASRGDKIDIKSLFRKSIGSNVNRNRSKIDVASKGETVPVDSMISYSDTFEQKLMRTTFSADSAFRTDDQAIIVARTRGRIVTE